MEFNFYIQWKWMFPTRLPRELRLCVHFWMKCASDTNTFGETVIFFRVCLNICKTAYAHPISQGHRLNLPLACNWDVPSHPNFPKIFYVWYKTRMWKMERLATILIATQKVEFLWNVFNLKVKKQLNYWSLFFFILWT